MCLERILRHNPSPGPNGSFTDALHIASCAGAFARAHSHTELIAGRSGMRDHGCAVFGAKRRKERSVAGGGHVHESSARVCGRIRLATQSSEEHRAGRRRGALAVWMRKAQPPPHEAWLGGWGLTHYRRRAARGGAKALVSSPRMVLVGEPLDSTAAPYKSEPTRME